MLEVLKENSIIWLIISLCGVIGLPVGIISLIKRDKKEISYAVSSYEIIKPGLNKKLPFSILYNKNKVENLSVSKIAIWNSGNQMLNMDDFVDGKQISIIWNNNICILESSLLSETDADNKCSLKQVDNKLLVSFDYLSPKDGIVIQIYHDKNFSDFSVAAKIKGGKRVKQSYNEKFNSYDAEFVKRNEKIQFFYNLYFVFAFSFFLGDSLKKLLKIQRAEPNIPLIIIGFLLMSISIFILIYGYFGSKRQLPKDLRKEL